MVWQPYAIWYHLLTTVDRHYPNAKGIGGMIAPALLILSSARPSTRLVAARPFTTQLCVSTGGVAHAH
jgi:hypothetical protein